MVGNAFLILIFVYAIALLVFYHKIFSVFYFDLFKGLLGEIFWCIVLGGILAFLTISFWMVAAVIIIVVGLIAAGRSGNKTPIAIAVILAIIIAVMGNSIKKNSKSSDSSSNSEESTVLVSASHSAEVQLPTVL